jgi:hypothetical protein
MSRVNGSLQRVVTWLTLKEDLQSQGSVRPLVCFTSQFKEQSPREAFLVHVGIFILFAQEPETQVQKQAGLWRIPWA